MSVHGRAAVDEGAARRRQLRRQDDHRSGSCETHGVQFLDLDAEVERHYGESIERLQARFLSDSGYRSLCADVLQRVLAASPDCVVALGPSGLRDAYLRVVRKMSCVAVVLDDRPENILERIKF